MTARTWFALAAAALAATATARPRCPECPRDAIFLKCTLGDDSAHVVLTPDEPTLVRVFGMKRALSVSASRSAPDRIRLTIRSTGAGGRVLREAEVAPGESLRIGPGGAVPGDLLGAVNASLTLAWVR